MSLHQITTRCEQLKSINLVLASPLNTSIFLKFFIDQKFIHNIKSLVPLKRITAIAAEPLAVDKATMVSLKSNIINFPQM